MAKRILIVDDDPDFRMSTTQILEKEAFEVSATPRGSEGFEKAKTEKPDAVLLDVMIENSSAGLDTARKLRDNADTVGIPVILLTGIRRADQLLSSYAPGEKWPNIKEALEKPVEPGVLIAKIKERI